MHAIDLRAHALPALCASECSRQRRLKPIEDMYFSRASLSRHGAASDGLGRFWCKEFGSGDGTQMAYGGVIDMGPRGASGNLHGIDMNLNNIE